MRYVKKTCILRQLKSGFTLDGKELSGLIKIEQYGANASAELAFSNLSPLREGGYFCILADPNRRFKIHPLDEGMRFSFSSDMDFITGFYVAVCFAREKVSPIAIGSCGKLPYDFFALIREAFSEPTPAEKETNPAHNKPFNADMPPTNPQINTDYNDELVADTNYFELKENDYVTNPTVQAEQDAPLARGDSHQGETGRADSAKNENHPCVRHAFTTETDGYYQSVKGELNTLFARYPKDDTLGEAYPHSEWVRVRGEAGAPEELVGLVYEKGMVKYICYALPATEKTPQEVKERGYFVPISALCADKGFFVLYQSAATGESLPKKEA